MGSSDVNALHHEQNKTKSGKQHPKRLQQKSKPPTPSDNTRSPPLPPTLRLQCRNCGGISPHTGDCPAPRKAKNVDRVAKVSLCLGIRSNRNLNVERFDKLMISQHMTPTSNYIFTLGITNNTIHHHCVKYRSQTSPAETIIGSIASGNNLDELTYNKIRNRYKSILLTSPQFN